jgi:hypothetical protein
VARLRLFLADDRFVAVYYNAQTGSISYAYIEGEQRLLRLSKKGFAQGLLSSRPAVFA